jgi:PleD family two-component response regulator
MHGARICRTKRRAVDLAQPGDRGTTAELWLPVANVSAQAVAPAEPVPAKSLQHLTILAVDDDSLVLMNTVAMFEDLGHIVFEARSGKEALEVLRREIPSTWSLPIRPCRK